jgi:outer membrane protein insertion porin family
VGGEYVLVRNVRQKWGYSLRYAHLKARKGSDMNPYELENIAERSYATLSTLSHTLSINVPLPAVMGRQSTAIIWGTAATGLGGNVSFLSNSISLNHYIPLPSSFLLRFESSYRWKNPWGFMRFNDSLDLSGYDFPGFELGGVGPKDGFTNEALYGKRAYVVAAKLDVPLPTGVELPVKGLLFVQAGSLWDSLFKQPRTAAVRNDSGGVVQETRAIRSPNFFTRVSAGVGIQASLPMVGNIGFVFSRALRKHPSDVTKKFEIVVGTKL